MQIKPPTQPLQTPIKQAQTVTPAQNNTSNRNTPTNWQVSQLIEAVILKITDKQILLDIQGSKVHSNKPDISGLKSGDQLKLQIEQLKPSPQFKIVDVQPAKISRSLVQALNTALPSNDATFTPLLKNIAYIANRPSLRPSPLAAEVNATVRELFKNIPAPFNLKTATQVKTQLQNSGIFIESKIKSALFDAFASSQTKTHSILETKLHNTIKSVLENDLGVKLYRLASLIKAQNPTATGLTQKTANPLHPQNVQNVAHQQAKTMNEQPSLQNIVQREEAMQIFLRQIESSLSHMQHTQLQNLNETQSGRPSWLMELPIKDGQDIDLFQFKINEEEVQSEQGERKKIWNITLQFNLNGLGEIKAHIKMQNEFISANFFSEKTNTLSLFKENIEYLRSRLNYNGLNVGNIECTNGFFHKLPANPQSPSVLDEHI